MSAPKKSHAFIITFILILILLFVGYWLFANKDKVFKTGGLNLGRIFEPLVESPDRKPLEVIWDRIFNPGENNKTTDPDEFVYDPNNNIHNFPVVNISANPSSVREGESSTISWSSTNSMSCDTGNGVQVGTSGSFSTGPLSKSNSFTVSCRGDNGTISNNIIVKVGDKKIDPFKFPTVSGIANPSPIEVGESSMISFESTNTTSCNSGAGNPTTTSGSFSTGPLYTTTSYSVICTGDDGTSGRNIFVIVKDDIGLNLNKCENSADNYPICTTKNGQCLNETTNPPLCTTLANGQCKNGAINPDVCDKFEHPFCAANRITKEMSSTNSGDKEQVKALQTILSKLPSVNGPTYLKETDVDGSYGPKTTSAVTLFQEDNGLKKTGDVDAKTIEALNNNCNEFFNKNNNNNNTNILECSDNIDNDGKEGRDSEDPSCHIDFNADNASSYDKNIGDESRTKTDTECGDGVNNDNEEGPDYKDKDCHTDGNVNNWESYYKDIRFEKSKGLPTPTNICTNKATNWPDCDIFEDATFGQCKNPEASNYPQCNKDKNGNCLNGAKNATCTPENLEKNKCAVFDQYPLEFTDEEKAELAELLRKFYLLAPTLKTEDDLNLLYNEIDRYKELINQTKELTRQCYLESASKEEWLYNGTEATSFCSRNPKLCKPTDTFNRSYTGPTTRFGNPWFKPDSAGSYVDKNEYKANVTTWNSYVNGKNDCALNKVITVISFGVFGNNNTNHCLDEETVKNKNVLKTHGDDVVSPLTTKFPPAQWDRNYRLNWYFGFDFDENSVMYDRLTEFEALLNIW